jgi:hypothetical protein
MPTPFSLSIRAFVDSLDAFIKLPDVYYDLGFLDVLKQQIEKQTNLKFKYTSTLLIILVINSDRNPTSRFLEGWTNRRKGSQSCTE